MSGVQGTGGIEAAKSEGAAGQTDTANPKPDGGKEKSSPQNCLPRCRQVSRAPGKQLNLKERRGKTEPANAKPDGGKETPSAGKQPQGKATDQSDDLLFPTEEELREIKARNKDVGKAAQPDEAPAGAAVELRHRAG